ncbi:MAG: acyl-CoA dehydrogenase [Pseudodonghicola sp.]
MSYQPDISEILFLLEGVLRWDSLFQLPSYAHADAETGAAVLTEGARFMAEVLSPLNRLGDIEGCRLEGGRVQVPAAFRAAYDQFAAGGWMALDLPEAIGGQALPVTVNSALSEMLSGACVAFGMLTCSTRAAAHLLAQHAPAPFGTDYAAKLGTGEATATIVITEAQAGTNVHAMRTRATPNPDGSWAINGGKIFISSGDHDYTEQTLHIVLAKTAGADGRDGLSLFVVPSVLADGSRNAITVVNIEHKMGLKASPTCQLAFEGAQGWQIGGPGEGLKRMFTMMNLMRMDVAIQSVGIAQAATQLAESYAEERRQGGDPDRGIIQFADVRRMVLEMRSLADAARALMLETSMQLDLVAQGDDDALALSQFLLPICKAWGSDQALRVANLGIQVMGGHGYIAESGMEQYLRDCRIMGIYEGANGIQGLDLVMRKLRRSGGAGYDLWAARMRADLAADSSDLAAPFGAALALLEQASADLRAADPARAEAAATAYLNLCGVTGMGWMWLRIARAAATRPDAAAKAELARFFMHYILPEAALFHRRIAEVALYA